MDAVIQALQSFFTWPAPLFSFLGILLGLLFGFIPGLGGSQAIALLIPLSYSMEPGQAIAMMVGAMGATPFGGSISAILINTPGTAQNAATCFDGFPLTKQGRAGYALGASASSSILGALFGVAVLAILIPLGKPVVLAFSYPEFCMMALMGISIIAIVSLGSIWKALVAGIFGLLLSSMGYEPVAGSIRFVFGVSYLYDGIKIVPALIGLFAITESLKMMIDGQQLTNKHSKFENVGVGVWDGIKEPFKHFWLFLRCSIIGVIIGIIPGVGGSVSNFVAYGHAVQTTKNNPHFGEGDVRGVIAPQASDTAKDGGALVPTLLFGIPGSVETAVLLGALILHGLQPGPKMLLTNPELVYVMVLALVASNVIAGLIGLLCAGSLSRLTMLPVRLIAPVVIVLALIGAYATQGIWGDVIIAIVFGVIGYFMEKCGFSRVPVIIALVLGKMAQQTFFQTLMTFGAAGFFLRPISLIMFIITLMAILSPFLKKIRKSKEAVIK